MSDQDEPSRPPNGCGTDTPDWHGQTYWNDDDRRRDYCSQACADARRHVVPADGTAEDLHRLSRNMRDSEAWRAAGCPPGLVTGMAAARDIRAILLSLPADLRVTALQRTGICRDCGYDVGDRRCQCTNDE